MSTASRYPATCSCHTALGRRKVSVFWRNSQNLFLRGIKKAGTRCAVSEEYQAQLFDLQQLDYEHSTPCPYCDSTFHPSDARRVRPYICGTLCPYFAGGISLREYHIVFVSSSAAVRSNRRIASSADIRTGCPSASATITGSPSFALRSSMARVAFAIPLCNEVIKSIFSCSDIALLFL